MENEQRKENNNKSRQEKRQESNRVQSDEEKAERFRKDKERRQQKRLNETREEREIWLARRRNAYKKRQKKIEVSKESIEGREGSRKVLKSEIVGWKP